VRPRPSWSLCCSTASAWSWTCLRGRSAAALRARGAGLVFELTDKATARSANPYRVATNISDVQLATLPYNGGLLAAPLDATSSAIRACTINCPRPELNLTMPPEPDDNSRAAANRLQRPAISSRHQNLTTRRASCQQHERTRALGAAICDKR
jgi:hypothetical protein